MSKSIELDRLALSKATSNSRIVFQAKKKEEATCKSKLFWENYLFTFWEFFGEVWKGKDKRTTRHQDFYIF